MILKLKQTPKKQNLQKLLSQISRLGLRPFVVKNKIPKIVIINNHFSPKVKSQLEALPPICQIIDTGDKLYRLASRLSKKENTKVKIGSLYIGGEAIVLMAGPCAVESKVQIETVALQVAKSGAKVLRGGAYKPRTEPYAFQGLEKIGLRFLREAADKAHLAVVTEVLDTRDVEIVGQFTDIYQVGARNMQNFALLKEVGKTGKPVLLKRGMWASYKEFLLAAEYILSCGNPNVILCERGIRTHVNELRFTLDLNAIPFLKAETHLPVIVDPSHGTGRADLVTPMSRAAIASGADGLIVEAHCNPEKSVSDKEQAISLEEFKNLVLEVRKIATTMGREVL